MSMAEGFLLAGINCGIKKKKLDLGLIYSKDPCLASAVFTTNVNPSYSVTVSKKNIKTSPRAILVNSGNANCHSHKSGLKDTEDIVSKTAKALGVKTKEILIASTGIIGKKLPKEKIIKKLPLLIKNLGKNTDVFAKSILTTDTGKKVVSANIALGKKKITIIGFAKGAGMIYPNMATMLGFILTDADVGAYSFNKAAKVAIEESFNSISIDGCTSTNDTVFFLSSKRIPLKGKKQLDLFSQKLNEVCLSLAKMIVGDGEGATKFVQITVKGAKTKAQAKQAGLALANSNLFKCTLYGANANWGRIVSALGQAGIKVAENISIKTTSLKKKNVVISVDLKIGKSQHTVYTTDLTPAYIKFNA
jgi:glutamate N-acetyltransferase/amino-acid N-acetyltransferase